MIAYIIGTCAKGKNESVQPASRRCKDYLAAAGTQQAAQRRPVDDGDRHGGRDGPPELQTQHHQGGERQENEQPAGMNSHVEWPRYFSRTRVPRIFWLLSALRKLGTSRSMSSKYEDSAGVFCCALYRISSR